MPVTVGTRIGRYEVTGLLGQGAMGEVYRAFDGLLGYGCPGMPGIPMPIPGPVPERNV